MKAKSRRRLLISSVAMLLVAMLALGTATFAWFTTNSSAKADQLQAYTTKASELKLSSTNIDWTDNLHYNYNKELKPASSADGVHWFTATAANQSAFDLDQTVGITPLGAFDKTKNGIDGFVFMDQLNVANFGQQAVENVQIKFSIGENAAKTGKKYLRFAIVEAASAYTTGDTLPAFATGATFAGGVYASAADTADALNSATITAGALSTTTVAAANGANVTIPVGNLAAAGSDGNPSASGVKYYNIYVWFEGQDADCTNTNAGNVMPEITFTVAPAA